MQVFAGISVLKINSRIQIFLLFSKVLLCGISSLSIPPVLFSCAYLHGVSFVQNTIGLDYLRGLFKYKWFYDSNIFPPFHSKFLLLEEPVLSHQVPCSLALTAFRTTVPELSTAKEVSTVRTVIQACPSEQAGTIGKSSWSWIGIKTHGLQK